MSRSLTYKSMASHEHQWLDDDDSPSRTQPADSAASLVSLGFFTAALRRSKWFWCTTAVVGLLVGVRLVPESPSSLTRPRQRSCSRWVPRRNPARRY